jgi:hypothetical protein
MFAREIGDLPAVSDQQMYLDMWGELLESARELSAHADEIATKLEAVRSKGGHAK